jgi:radical SAM protein with 4Fe4S-binding SPASM domain
MTTSHFEMILRQLSGKAHLLHFHVMGEPLLHPEVGGFLDRCAENGFKVNLVTNGTLLGDRGGDLAGKKALKQVSVSLQSLAPGARGATMDGYFRGLFDFVERNRQSASPCAISLRLWNLGGGADRSFQEAIARAIGDFFSLPALRIDELTPENPVRLAENVFLNPAPRFEWPDLSGPEIARQGFCLGLRDQIAILVDGSVVPCCLDHAGVITLGNITRRPFEEILAGDRARKIREGFTKGEIVEELCRKCSYRLRFNLE